jgi:Holliday junction resolvase
MGRKTQVTLDREEIEKLIRENEAPRKVTKFAWKMRRVPLDFYDPRDPNAHYLVVEGVSYDVEE